jgi:class 3 adenylate cyclase
MSFAPASELLKECRDRHSVQRGLAALRDEAKPGQILISPRVLMAVEKDTTVEPVGDFALKGIRRPMTAYNVLAAKAAN